jgi:hypothetical protein
MPKYLKQNNKKTLGASLIAIFQEKNMRWRKSGGREY